MVPRASASPGEQIATGDPKAAELRTAVARGEKLRLDEASVRQQMARQQVSRGHPSTKPQNRERVSERGPQRRRQRFTNHMLNQWFTVVPRALNLQNFLRVALGSQTLSHAPSFAQKAAETALEQGEEELRAMLARLKENRDFCLAALRKMPGVTVPEPEGAFYLFPRIEGLTDSFAFCRRLLEETRVGLAPGVAFGAGGEGSLRICYAAERGILEEAMARLGEFLRTGPGFTPAAGR